MFTIVYEGVKIKQDEHDPEPDLHVAIKKIKIERLKEDIMENKVSNEITEGDLKKVIEKLNRELENMKTCQCENSVKIYDYFYKTNNKEKEEKKEGIKIKKKSSKT